MENNTWDGFEAESMFVNDQKYFQIFDIIQLNLITRSNGNPYVHLALTRLDQNYVLLTSLRHHHPCTYIPSKKKFKFVKLGLVDYHVRLG
jgi:hypothetical protein